MSNQRKNLVAMSADCSSCNAGATGQPNDPLISLSLSLPPSSSLSVGYAAMRYLAVAPGLCPNPLHVRGSKSASREDARDGVKTCLASSPNLQSLACHLPEFSLPSLLFDLAETSVHIPRVSLLNQKILLLSQG